MAEPRLRSEGEKLIVRKGAEKGREQRKGQRTERDRGGGHSWRQGCRRDRDREEEGTSLGRRERGEEGARAVEKQSRVRGEASRAPVSPESWAGLTQAWGEVRRWS